MVRFTSKLTGVRRTTAIKIDFQYKIHFIMIIFKYKTVY